MSPHVEVQPLSRGKRRLVFGLSLAIFVIAVPISVFYATGYRFDFGDKFNSIKRVGGLYVRNDVSDTEMFVNDEPVVDMRVFQSAAYIQNLTSGQHTVRVQGAGLTTWVKELPVYPHLVTEVSSFNLPTVPQVRVITPWQQPLTGDGVVFDTATSTLRDAHILNTLVFSSTTATTSLTRNLEYSYVYALLASSTVKDTVAAQSGRRSSVLKKTFDVATSSAVLLTATTTKVSRDTSLFEKDGEVYARFLGADPNVPYYYCVLYEGEERAIAQYGEHVFTSLTQKYGTSTQLQKREGERLCRDSIRIDRLRQEVLWFDFLPNSTDLVLMLLTSGLYVVEIDDRGWQNTQLLYKGTDVSVAQDGGRIFIEDNENVFEIFTSVVSSI